MSFSAAFLQINLNFKEYRPAVLCFLTAFITAMIIFPPLISFLNRHKLEDVPNHRKEHSQPVPTMGGVAIILGSLAGLLLWFPFAYESGQVSFFFAILALMTLGVMDDLRDLNARYKFVVQIALALMISACGIRINNLGGLFGMYELPVISQYFLTVLTIVGVTNAFNLVDGIDGLAGGLAFMSLLAVGLTLTQEGDLGTALIAFSFCGSILAFLYFNLNPARIFMGDTGSTVLGFVIAVLCIRLMQVNHLDTDSGIPGTPVFILGFVLIPVFDTLRVFASRTWKGHSPFQADRTHIHHLLTNNGFNHRFTARVILSIHAAVLLVGFLLKDLRQEYILAILLLFMIAVAALLNRLHHVVRPRNLRSGN